jgi:hypothetical protein
MNHTRVGLMLEMLIDDKHTSLEFRGIAGEGHSPRAQVRRSVPDKHVVIVDGIEQEHEQLEAAMEMAVSECGFDAPPRATAAERTFEERHKELDRIQTRFLTARDRFNKAQQAIWNLKTKRKWNRAGMPKAEEELTAAQAEYAKALSDLETGRTYYGCPNKTCVFDVNHVSECRNRDGDLVVIQSQIQGPAGPAKACDEDHDIGGA